MSVIPAVTTTPVTDVALVAWLLVTNGDTGDAQLLAQYADKTISISGTFGSGGSMTLQGSNDGTNWHTLVDPQGNALTFTAAGMEQVLENPIYVRPNVTAGDGTTSLNVRIACKGV